MPKGYLIYELEKEISELSKLIEQRELSNDSYYLSLESKVNEDRLNKLKIKLNIMKGR